MGWFVRLDRCAGREGTGEEGGGGLEGWDKGVKAEVGCGISGSNGVGRWSIHCIVRVGV